MRNWASIKNAKISTRELEKWNKMNTWDQKSYPTWIEEKRIAHAQSGNINKEKIILAENKDMEVECFTTQVIDCEEKATH